MRSAQHAGRVLIVDDAEAIRTAVSSALAAAGYVVAARANGAEFEAQLVKFRPDVVVLDVMLPGCSGFDLLEAVRARCNAGVVMLTARDSVEDRVSGLAAGADDYVIKPFLLAELVARIDALLRRMGHITASVTIGDLLIDVNGRGVFRDGVPIVLTTTEFDILAYLAAHRGKVLTKTQILTSVWGYNEYDTNLVEVFVSSLRRKLEVDGPRLIHTVRGHGYTMQAGWG
ncbi:response regulator transcription factor [Nocardia colli]|uniref:response regulator transcription factor n=1 Tax=Nocardia colli TaxID=2545717 RepID=UPI0035D54109